MRNNRTISHRKITTYKLSPESDAYRQNGARTITNSRPATAGTLGERGRGGDDDEVMLNVLRCQLTY